MGNRNAGNFMKAVKADNRVVEKLQEAAKLIKKLQSKKALLENQKEGQSQKQLYEFAKKMEAFLYKRSSAGKSFQLYHDPNMLEAEVRKMMKAVGNRKAQQKQE